MNQNNFLKLIGKRVKTIRMATPYKKKESWKDDRFASQEYIANKAGISKNQLYLIESGKNSKIETLLQISDALDFPVYGLLLINENIDSLMPKYLADTKKILSLIDSIMQHPEKLKKAISKLESIK